MKCMHTSIVDFVASDVERGQLPPERAHAQQISQLVDSSFSEAVATQVQGTHHDRRHA
jgi:hypothetical protein